MSIPNINIISFIDLNDYKIPRNLPTKNSIKQNLSESLKEEFICLQLLVEKFQTSEAQIRSFFEAMTEVVLILDKNLDNINITPTSAVLENNSSFNIAEETVNYLLKEEVSEEIRLKIKQVLNSQKKVNYEYYLIKDDNKLWFNATIAPIREQNMVTFIARDVTEQKQIQEKLQQQQEELIAKNIALNKANMEATLANKVKSEFLTNISHEIRTPLNAVIGFSDLLKDLIMDSDAQSYLDIIISSGENLLELINDILDLSKIESGQIKLCYESFNCHKLIQEIVEIFAPKALEKKLNLLIEIDENIPVTIIFDLVRLRQILFNVVGNALKFTEKGYVKISMKLENKEDLENNCTLIIDIEDTGIGIAPDQQERIFDVFVQSDSKNNRKYEGTGLGLTITKRLTEMLEGTITLQSELNKGSIFSFTFPNIEISNN